MPDSWKSQWDNVFHNRRADEAQTRTNKMSSWLIDEYQVQLGKEFTDICYQRRIKMSPVPIEVGLAKSYWGRWDPLLKRIDISVWLIKEYTWTVVLEVLKHEMAHQYVLEHCPKAENRETSHGPSFQKACQILGVSPCFRKATGDLPRDVEQEKSLQAKNSSQKILNKISKLLSLAQSSNEHESFLAMKKVHELYRKYNLEEQRGQENPEFRIKILLLNKKRVASHHSHIVGILCRHYFVRVIASWQYNAKLRDTFKCFEILGTQPNIEMAEYVFHFLASQSEYLWTVYKQKTGISGRLKNSFLLGVLSGFDDKLTQLGKPSSVSNISSTDRADKALLSLGNQALDNFLNDSFPRLSHRSVKASRVNGAIYESGRQNGKTLNLHRGLRETKKSDRRLGPA